MSTSTPPDAPREGSVRTVVSGGQAGVDRLAIEVALARGLAVRGHAPPRGAGGAEALDLFPWLVPIDAAAVAAVRDADVEHYYPAESASAEREALRARLARTRRNVEQADATLVLCATERELAGGTLAARDRALSLGKPCSELIAERVAPEEERAVWRGIARALREAGAESLNVAGPLEASGALRRHLEGILDAVTSRR